MHIFCLLQRNTDQIVRGEWHFLVMLRTMDVFTTCQLDLHFLVMLRTMDVFTTCQLDLHFLVILRTMDVFTTC